jgi:hypothetical protein
MASCGCKGGAGGGVFRASGTMDTTDAGTGCKAEGGCLQSGLGAEIQFLDDAIGCGIGAGGCGSSPAASCCGEFKSCRQSATTATAVSGKSCPIAPSKVSQNYVIKLKAPAFVTPQPASLNEVTLALDDSALEYKIFKVPLDSGTGSRKSDMSLGGGETKSSSSRSGACTFAYEVRLMGRLHFQVQYNAFVSSPTIESTFSNWPLTSTGSLPIDKYIVTLSSRPTLPSNCPTGFRGKLAEYLDPVGSSVAVEQQMVKVRIQTNFTAYADWFRQVNICGIGICNCIVTGVQPWHVDIIDAQGNLVQSLTADTSLQIPGQWTTTSAIDAGVYTIKYVCNNINSTTGTMKELYCFTDFFHLDNTKTQATNLACQTC